jgi:hypothetical protein
MKSISISVYFDIKDPSGAAKRLTGYHSPPRTGRLHTGFETGPGGAVETIVESAIGLFTLYPDGAFRWFADTDVTLDNIATSLDNYRCGRFVFHDRF